MDMRRPDNESHILFTLSSEWRCRFSSGSDFKAAFLSFSTSSAAYKYVGHHIHFIWICWECTLVDSQKDKPELTCLSKLNFKLGAYRYIGSPVLP